MNYCPKCGNKLNEDDKFCSNCGEPIVLGEEKKTNRCNTSAGKEFFNSTYKPDYSANAESTHPLAKTGFILSLVALGIFALLIVIIAMYYNQEEIPAIIALALAGLILIGMIIGIASLGVSIPGYILTKKRNYSKKIAVASLVLSIIVCTIILIVYIEPTALPVKYLLVTRTFFNLIISLALIIIRGNSIQIITLKVSQMDRAKALIITAING